MIGLIALGGVTIALLLTMVRLLAGPTLYDRAFAASLLVMQAVLLCAGAAIYLGQAVLIDVALGLVFGALVLSVAILKFFRVRTLQAPLVRVGEDA